MAWREAATLEKIAVLLRGGFDDRQPVTEERDRELSRAKRLAAVLIKMIEITSGRDPV